jgi:hypothetical protein
MFMPLFLTGFDDTPFAGLDGITVSQFLAIDNMALGGGSTSYSINDLKLISTNLNPAFGAA